MADEPKSVRVETVREHQNSYGDTFEKAVGDQYDVIDENVRGLLTAQGLVKVVGAAKAAKAAA